MNEFPRELQHGSGVKLVLDQDCLVVALKKSLERHQLQAYLKQTGFELETTGKASKEGAQSGEQPIRHTQTRFWIRSASDQPVDQKQIRNLRNVLKASLDWIGPVYQMEKTQGQEGMVCPIPNVLLIRPAKQFKNNEASLAQILSEYGLMEVPQKSKYMVEYLYFVIPDLRKNDAYRLQGLVQKELNHLISDVRLENMSMVTDHCHNPNDKDFPSQWNMRKIKAPGGWMITTGDENMVIAIIDDAFDMNHPDIRFSALSINLDDMTTRPDAPVTSQRTQWHGTVCAGIAAARINNNRDVAGVAGGCQIMALARQGGSDSEVARGVKYAADHGAKVISMSFAQYLPGEGGGSTGWDFTVIDRAIEYATTKGVVICAATGNTDLNHVIGYPARHPLVMACGASNMADKRKSKTNGGDGEPDWGSNYGTMNYAGTTTGVSVVAPGIRIPTTDIQGAGGYSTKDFYLSFSGTSAATPHVAGLAALLFSIAPMLSNAEVRNLIEKTAEKVGNGNMYHDDTDFPNGTYNPEMGYGRINVLKALQKAAPQFPDP
jgi:subtilisin family serine protease